MSGAVAAAREYIDLMPTTFTPSKFNSTTVMITPFWLEAAVIVAAMEVVTEDAMAAPIS